MHTSRIITLQKAQFVTGGIIVHRQRQGHSRIVPAVIRAVFDSLRDQFPSRAEQAYKDSLILNYGMSSGKPKFCPKALVPRGLGAYMIVRAKNLTMP